MSFQVTARKWRPQLFSEVVGQEHVTATLTNALASGRVAHCYLFCGPRGVGKTTTARILAKALNCAAPGDQRDPCGECPSCAAITGGTSMDVLEIDGASNNSVDDARELREVVRYIPTEGAHKIYIIDEVHMLSKAAFNALLKTLEEPPARVVFVFATTEVQQVPETILSRCQRFNFRRISTSVIAGHLERITAAEGIDADQEALYLLAHRADGALRDAESLLDQVVSFGGRVTTASVREVLGLVDRGVFFEITSAIAAGDGGRLLDLVASVLDEGGDLEEFVRGLVEHASHLLFTKVQGAAARLEVSEDEARRFEEAAGPLAEEDLLRIVQTLMELETEVRRSLQPRFRTELALVRLAGMGRAVDVGRLLARLSALEAAVGGGAPAAAGPRRPPSTTAPDSGPAVSPPAREGPPPGRGGPEPGAASPASAAYPCVRGRGADSRSGGSRRGIRPRQGPRGDHPAAVAAGCRAVEGDAALDGRFSSGCHAPGAQGFDADPVLRPGQPPGHGPRGQGRGGGRRRGGRPRRTSGASALQRRRELRRRRVGPEFARGGSGPEGADRPRSPRRGAGLAVGPQALDDLVTAFARLPGIGRKTAQRLALHVLKSPPQEAAALADAIRGARDRIGHCTLCYNLTESEQPLCRVCRDESRDRRVICVVEEASDALALERSELMQGTYHVLGGALSPLDGIGPGDLRIAELLERVRRDGVREVILAHNASAEGEATAEYIHQRLDSMTRITRLARGLPAGSDLDLADRTTLAHALQGRTTF